MPRPSSMRSLACETKTEFEFDEASSEIVPYVVIFFFCILRERWRRNESEGNLADLRKGK